tara:strand:+ start:16 stop:408 length:393 start_codon:yes stop_codon:yes gene_type:complete
MLNITKKIEYALIAIRHMNNSKELCSSREISSQYNIPHEIMAKTLQQLSKIGYLHAIKGPNGGYYVNKTINKVKLIDFIENIEGPFGLVQCSTNSDCDLIEFCNIKSPIDKINLNLRKALSEIKLNDVAN